MVQFPQLRIEVAFSVGASTGTLLVIDDPTRGKIGSRTLGDGTDTDPVWTDVTPWATEGTTKLERGTSRVSSPLVTFDPGTATIPLDNSDRRFDPTHLDGPYVDPLTGTTRVTPRRAIRVQATWAGTTYELWSGTADWWGVDWAGPEHSVTVVTATDAFKILSGIDRTAIAETGAGETTGARVTRILDDIGWDADDRLVATGDSPIQATTLGGDPLAELQEVAKTELGELYVDGGGRIVFRNRLAILTDSRSASSQGIFGDEDGELPYAELRLASDDATFANDIRITRRSTGEGDVPEEQVYGDLASQALYYRRTFRAEPLLQTDAEARDYARWLRHVASDPEVRFDSIMIEPATLPADLWPHALGRQIGDRITVRRRPPGGGDPIERDCFVRGITHEFGGEMWRTTWALQSADRYGSFMTLDDPLLGALGSNALAY